MEIVSAILGFILLVLFAVGFVWSLIGLPVGMVLLIMFIVMYIIGKKDDEPRRSKIKKWIIISFGGLPLILLVAVIWGILKVIESAFGISIIGIIPQI